MRILTSANVEIIGINTKMGMVSVRSVDGITLSLVRNHARNL